MPIYLTWISGCSDCICSEEAQLVKFSTRIKPEHLGSGVMRSCEGRSFATLLTPSPRTCGKLLLLCRLLFFYYLFVWAAEKSGLKRSSKSENDQSSQEFIPCAPAPSKSSRCCATTEIWEHFFANSIHRVVKLSHKTSDDSGSFEPFYCCVLHSHASPTKSHFSMRPLSLVYFKLMLAFPRLLSAPRIFPH